MIIKQLEVGYMDNFCYIIWPGHDYGPTPSSTIYWEKRNNVNDREYGYFVED